MVLAQLPAILCIPEASTYIPQCAQNLVQVHDNDQQLIKGLATIFDLGHRVKYIVKGSIHPALMDLNAGHQEAIKVKVSHANKAQWLENYYYPFHKQLQEASNDANIKIGFDCHIMDDLPNKSHAIIGLFNKGNGKGQQAIIGKGLSCSPEILRDMMDIATAIFSKYDRPLCLNPTDHHGFIIDHYGKSSLPWIRIGLSRSLLLGEMSKTFDHHIQLLQEHFQSIITYLFKVEDWMGSDESN